MERQDDWQAVIGLEVHVQLGTRTKIFCRCPNRFGAAANTLVCPICLGYPGTLPVLNGEAVSLGIRLALALGTQVHLTSVFARKNYFYPDLPKGYQISQFDRPLAEHGLLPLSEHDKTVRITRLHLEEDAGKLLHEAPGGGALPGTSLVDFNRCGVPLAEIVSEPDLRSAGEAQDYLQTLRQVLFYTETSDGNMEEGSLRCDANISVRRLGDETLGTRSEVKNLNSFRFVAKAIEYEIERQVELLESGGRVIQETRTYDSVRNLTFPMRSKEEAHDYRYFPEPDLPPLRLDQAQIEAMRSALPELPWVRRQRYREGFGLSAEDARLLSSSRPLGDYFERAAGLLPERSGSIANWIKTEILRELKDRRIGVEQAIDTPRLVALVELVGDGKLSSSAGKQVLAALWGSGEEPLAAAQRLGLLQVSDVPQLRSWVEQAISDNPQQATDFRAGKEKLQSFFVGQVMRLSRGRAEPQTVQQLVRELLAQSGD